MMLEPMARNPLIVVTGALCITAKKHINSNADRCAPAMATNARSPLVQCQSRGKHAYAHELKQWRDHESKGLSLY